jgi:hypothetical protein
MDRPGVAVAFLIFNRPQLTRRVFERIRGARPAQLLVVADGPRRAHPGDIEKCAAARAVTEEIDWPCTVYRNYADSNLGCGRRVASGLEWVFSQVEMAIILEDDCLPDPTFFPYCAELLEKYRGVPQIGMVSGSHHQEESAREGDSYYFCRYGNIWGWATWRRAWENYDFGMSDWPRWRDAGHLERMFPAKEVREFWRGVWNETAQGRHDTWDYQWTFCYLRHGLLGVLPRVSLIENIGFGSDASHTAGMEFSKVKVESMEFPLRHPATIEPSLEAEARASLRFFSRQPILKRVAARLGRLRTMLRL